MHSKQICTWKTETLEMKEMPDDGPKVLLNVAFQGYSKVEVEIQTFAENFGEKTILLNNLNNHMVKMTGEYQSAFSPNPFSACLMAQEQSEQDGKDGELP